MTHDEARMVLHAETPNVAPEFRSKVQDAMLVALGDMALVPALQMKIQHLVEACAAVKKLAIERGVVDFDPQFHAVALMCEDAIRNAREP